MEILLFLSVFLLGVSQLILCIGFSKICKEVKFIYGLHEDFVCESSVYFDMVDRLEDEVF